MVVHTDVKFKLLRRVDEHFHIFCLVCSCSLMSTAKGDQQVSRLPHAPHAARTVCRVYLPVQGAPYSATTPWVNLVKSEAEEKVQTKQQQLQHLRGKQDCRKECRKPAS